MEELVNARNHVAVISVEGMICNSCVSLVQHAVSELQGINAVNVRIVSGFDERISLSAHSRKPNSKIYSCCNSMLCGNTGV